MKNQTENQENLKREKEKQNTKGVSKRETAFDVNKNAEKSGVLKVQSRQSVFKKTLFAIMAVLFVLSVAGGGVPSW